MSTYLRFYGAGVFVHQSEPRSSIKLLNDCCINSICSLSNNSARHRAFYTYSKSCVSPLLLLGGGRFTHKFIGLVEIYPLDV